MKPISTNPLLESIRAAYRNSAAYRAISEGKPLRNTVAAALAREPGSDDEPNVAGATAAGSASDAPSGVLPVNAAPATPKKPVEYRPDMSVEDYERYLGEFIDP